MFMTYAAVATRAIFTALKSRVSLITLWFCLFVSAASAQTTTSVTDGATPPGLAPGAPAGSFALSDFDNINLYNGNLNFSMPLLRIGGRGDVQYAITLRLGAKWRVEHTVTPPPPPPAEPQEPIHTYTPTPDWWSNASSFCAGSLHARHVGRDPLQVCGQTMESGFFLETLTRLTFTTPDGTEYELRD
jgi:hypothetical protein